MRLAESGGQFLTVKELPSLKGVAVRARRDGDYIALQDVRSTERVEVKVRIVSDTPTGSPIFFTPLFCKT